MQSDGQSSLSDLKLAFENLELALLRNDLPALEAATESLRQKLTTFQPASAMKDDDKASVVAMEQMSREIAERLADRIESYDRLIAHAIKPAGSMGALPDE